MHIVPPQLATGSSATDADLADRRARKRSLYVPFLHGAILPVSFFSLIVSGCKSEHDAKRVVPTASVVNSPKDQCTIPDSAICTRPPGPGLHTF